MLETRLVSRNLDRLSSIAVIYTDMDGTMLGARGSFLHGPEGEQTLEPVRALLAALDAGIDIVPASGRALRGLQTDARLLALSTCIAEMGALISYDFGREVVKNFGATPREGMPAAIMEEDGAVKLLLDRYGDRLEHHTPWSGWRECTQLFRGLVDTAEVDAVLADNGFGWLFLHDNGRLHGAYLGLERGSVRAYHLQPKGVTKGTAVALDREKRGIPLEQTIAIGDSMADLELASHVGTFVLVGDALSDDPALVAAVDALDNVIVTDRPQNLGWTDVVRTAAARA